MRIISADYSKYDKSQLLDWYSCLIVNCQKQQNNGHFKVINMAQCRHISPREIYAYQIDHGRIITSMNRYIKYMTVIFEASAL